MSRGWHAPASSSSSSCQRAAPRSRRAARPRRPSSYKCWRRARLTMPFTLSGKPRRASALRADHYNGGIGYGRIQSGPKRRAVAAARGLATCEPPRRGRAGPTTKCYAVAQLRQVGVSFGSVSAVSELKGAQAVGAARLSQLAQGAARRKTKRTGRTRTTGKCDAATAKADAKKVWIRIVASMPPQRMHRRQNRWSKTLSRNNPQKTSRPRREFVNLSKSRTFLCARAWSLRHPFARWA